MAGSAVIGALRVNLGIDSAAFQDGLKRAQAGVKRFGPMIAAGLAAAAAGAAAALGGVALAIRGVLEEADSLSKAAQSIGVATDELSKLKWAAEQSGVSFEDLTGSLAKLSNAMAQSLRSATSQQAEAFKALGVAVTNADGTLRDNRAVLGDVATAFARMKDSTNKTALAIQIFGRSGAQLIPFLNNGEAGLRAFGDEAERLGIVIGTDTGKAAERFNDTMNRISTRFEGLKVQIATAVLPALNDFADWFDRFDPAGFLGKIGEIKAALNELGNSPFWARFNQAMGVDAAAAQRSFDALRTGSPNMAKAIADRQAELSLLEQQLTNARELGFATDELEGKIASARAALADLVRGDRRGPNAGFAPGGFTFGVPKAEAVAPVVEQIQQAAKATSGMARASAEVTDAWAGLREATLSTGTAMSGLEDLAGSVSQTMASGVSSWVDKALDGTFKLSDAIADLGRQIARVLVNRAVSSLFGTGGLNLPGFANGGSFQVGGSGGIDSQLVAFRASPNETVRITKPGQMSGQTVAAPVNVQVINNNGSQVSTQGRGTMADPLRIVVDAVKGDMAKGGFDQAMSGRYGARPQARSR